MITDNKLHDPDGYHIILYSKHNNLAKNIMSLCPHTGNDHPLVVVLTHVCTIMSTTCSMNVFFAALTSSFGVSPSLFYFLCLGILYTSTSSLMSSGIPLQCCVCPSQHNIIVTDDLTAFFIPLSRARSPLGCSLLFGILRPSV